MVIMNTWFQQPLHRLYTWKSPGYISRNQIDYIMINQRFKNCVKQARTFSEENKKKSSTVTDRLQFTKG